MKATELPDWQLGNESKSSPLDRCEMMREWLLQNKLDCITKTKPKQDKEEVIGFVDIDIYE